MHAAGSQIVLGFLINKMQYNELTFFVCGGEETLTSITNAGVYERGKLDAVVRKHFQICQFRCEIE